MQQCGLAAVKRRIEPEPALGREFRRHLYIGDQELILEHFAGKLRADQTTQRRARTVACDDIIRLQMIAAVRRIDGENGMIVALLQPDNLVAPTQVDLRQLADAIDQKCFGIILLQIDEGRHLVTVFRQQIELIEQLILKKDLADLPDHALFDHALGDAEAIPQFQRALGETDGARALTDPVGIIQHHDGMAALCQIDGERQADRPRPDHHHRMAGGIRRRPALIGVAAIAKLGDGRIRHVSDPAIIGFLNEALV